MPRSRKEAPIETPKAESADMIKARKAELYKENSGILSDSIFEKITSTIDKGWDGLNEDKRTEVLDALDELLVAIKNYDDSYRKLKGIASYRLSDTASARIQERQKNDIEDADRRERELHNRFLDTVNILSRRMHEVGLDNSWRGDEAIFPVAGDEEGNRRKVKQWMFRIFSD